ncbi:MAG: hypothetical protein KTR27_11150 [Leptolyngbyaceae cyanobacterium MAG.088]|nr:hypothetical protein [Leptolyngbyaceae cyanobacterium MAG.088]
MSSAVDMRYHSVLQNIYTFWLHKRVLIWNNDLPLPTDSPTPKFLALMRHDALIASG